MESQISAGGKKDPLGVFRLGFFQDGNVGVSIFPQREKILIGCLGFGGVALQQVSAGEAEMRERTGQAGHDF